jgi:hypothetical protein
LQIGYYRAAPVADSIRLQPFCTRFGALLNDAQSIGVPPTSVAAGNCGEGNCLPIASLCGMPHELRGFEVIVSRWVNSVA